MSEGGKQLSKDDSLSPMVTILGRIGLTALLMTLLRLVTRPEGWREDSEKNAFLFRLL